MKLGQRAMVAAKVCSLNEQSTRTVSKTVGVALGYIGQASIILQHRPDLADLVITGAMSLNDAYEKAQGSDGKEGTGNYCGEWYSEIFLRKNTRHVPRKLSTRPDVHPVCRGCEPTARTRRRGGEVPRVPNEVTQNGSACFINSTRHSSAVMPSAWPSSLSASAVFLGVQ
jgi:hypothetical protein